jgi:hypothetical protein
MTSTLLLIAACVATSGTGQLLLRLGAMGAPPVTSDLATWVGLFSRWHIVAGTSDPHPRRRSARSPGRQPRGAGTVTDAIVYRASRWLGGILASVKLAERRVIAGPDGHYWWKRRHPWAGAVVAAGNACLAVSRVPQRMLARDAWAAREIETYALAYGARVERVAPGVVLIPALPGVPAAPVLASRDAAADEKAGIMTAAARALAALHRLVVRAADGSRETFSHGDPTVANVLWDPVTRQASWLDFEMAHDGRRPELERRVHDLRTLSYSAAAALTPDEYGLVPASLVTGYADRNVLDALCTRLRVPASPLLPLWNAHVPRRLAEVRAFEATLRAGLEAGL